MARDVTEREVDCDGAEPVNSTTWIDRIMQRNPLPISCRQYNGNFVKVVSSCSLTNADSEDARKCKEVRKSSAKIIEFP